LGAIVWSSDYETAGAGWRLCPPGAGPFRAEEERPVADASGSGKVIVLIVLSILAVVACACWRRMRGAQDSGIGDDMPKSVFAQRRGMQD
jgi:hypothetical protein